MLIPISPRIGEEPGQLAGLVGHRDVHRAHRPGGAAVLARDRPGAGHATRQQLAEALTRALADGVDQQVQLAAHLAEQAEDRFGVAGDDLLPQGRVATGHAGDVADALARQREVGGRSVGQPAGHQDGEQVRQVGGPGDGEVVLLGRQPHRNGSAEAGQLVDERHRLRVCLLVRGDRPRAPVEQGSARGERAGALGARHRVAADVPSEAGLACTARSGPVLMLPTSVTTASEAASASRIAAPR